MRIITVDRCSRCPYRFADVKVADGSMDFCIRRQRGLDYRACTKKHEFPKACPLAESKPKKVIVTAVEAAKVWAKAVDGEMAVVDFYKWLRSHGADIKESK